MNPSRTFTLTLLLLACLFGSAQAQSIPALQDYKLGRVLASGGRWEEALVALERALKEDRDYPDALYLAGLCHANLEQYDRAIERLKRVTELRPEFFAAWGHLSRLHVIQKQYDQAGEVLGALGKVRGGAPESHYGFGVLAWAQNRLEVAETEWREAIRLSPGMAKAHHNLGILYREKQERARALSALQDAVRLDPESPLYRLSLGWLQVDMGNRVDGMANLDRVRSQTERPDLASLALAVQMLLHGHPEPAEKAAARALEANPELTLALVLRARALEALQRPSEARALYEQALEQDQTLGEARRALERIPAPEPPVQTEEPTTPEAPVPPEDPGHPQPPVPPEGPAAPGGPVPPEEPAAPEAPIPPQAPDQPEGPGTTPEA